MKTFRYKCISEDGAKVSGVIKSYDEFEAVSSLRESYKIVTDIEEVKETDEKGRRTKKVIFNEKDLAMMCSQFSIILTSGLPVVRCLEMVSSQSKNKNVSAMLLKVAEDVDGGYSMASAFERNAPSLPKTFIETVRAGEESGTLESCFNKLHTYYDKSARMKQKIISTLTYPAIVVVVAIVVFIIVMVVAVPMFISTFEELGIDLPWITKAMIATSKAITGYWWLLALIAAALIGGYTYYRNTEDGKRKIGRFKLTRAPLRKINSMNAASQFASTMATMLSSGLPIIKALEITSEVVTNKVYGLAIRKVKEGVEQGRSMVDCMSEIPYFSRLLTEMTGVGETSGSMEETLEIVGNYFSNEVDIRSQRLLSIMEPIITIALAIVAVFLLLGVYLPMFDMYGAM